MTKSDLLTYEDALAQILSVVSSSQTTESVPLAALTGRVTSEDVYARIAVPPFANSAMDGFAIDSAALGLVQEFPVTQRIAAGDCPQPLKAGTAAQIFTGAPIPEGADTVVIQENARWINRDTISFDAQCESGKNIRPAGDDIQSGSLAIHAGTKVNARVLGLLHALGETSVTCYRKLRVALISTGSEIREPGEPLAYGEIYNSNYPMIAAELRALDVDVIDLGVVADSANGIRDALETASAAADFVITIGGMSVGGEDHVRDQVQALGDLSLWKVAIKPGKPLGFGRIGCAQFFGLPGNPVSSFVTFFLFVRPALRKASGMSRYVNASSWATADFDYHNKGRRKEFVRVAIEPNLVAGLPLATLYRTQSSGVLSSLFFADALGIIEAKASVRSGEPIRLLPLF